MQVKKGLFQFITLIITLTLLTTSFSKNAFTLIKNNSACSEQAVLTYALSQHLGEGHSLIEQYLQMPEAQKLLTQAAQPHCLSQSQQRAEELQRQDLDLKRFPVTDQNGLSGQVIRVLDEKGTLLATFSLSYEKMILWPFQKKSLTTCFGATPCSSAQSDRFSKTSAPPFSPTPKEDSTSVEIAPGN